MLERRLHGPLDQHARGKCGVVGDCDGDGGGLKRLVHPLIHAEYECVTATINCVGRNIWEGNIGYNDGHVEFETRPDPSNITCRRTTTAAPLTKPDKLFVDETDDASNSSDQSPTSLAGSNQVIITIGKVDFNAANVALTLSKG